jgi:hypothetical protein
VDRLRETGIVESRISLSASGPGGFVLRRLRIDRDVHYTTHPTRTERAAPGRPFRLQPNEYFVLGDNSPDSRDSREWTEADPRIRARHQIGVVPGDQIVGPAAFVYLPALLPSGLGAAKVVPDLGRTRFIR